MGEQEPKGTIIFRPMGSHEVVVTSPEQLANAGLYIHPDAIERTWGKGAVERYRDAMIARTIEIVPTTPGAENLLS